MPPHHRQNFRGLLVAECTYRGEVGAQVDVFVLTQFGAAARHRAEDEAARPARVCAQDISDAPVAETAVPARGAPPLDGTGYLCGDGS